MHRINSDPCIHLEYYPGTRYEPAESYCEYAEENGYDCENCPHHLSKEDIENIREDFEYDRYVDRVYFGI